MYSKAGIYDLHITVSPDSLNFFSIDFPWQVHEICNVQGLPHYIISLKHVGSFPHEELKKMADALRSHKVCIVREKIERHFPSSFQRVADIGSDGVIEVHYKYAKKGIFQVTEAQIAELNKKKLALSFNVGTLRPIISVRFSDSETYLKKGVQHKPLPPYLLEEEREVVTFDTNSTLDSFWPMRAMSDKKFSFSDFPAWLMR